MIDSTPFANELALLNRNNFDSADGTGAAYGWDTGTWGGVSAPSLVPTIDSTGTSPAQKLFIYNYTGNSREYITVDQTYIKTAAYIKSTGYEFETSLSVAQGYDTSTMHYIFGVWLKAEGMSPNPGGR